MKSNLNDEPSLDKIDDFKGNESPKKKRTVYLVVIFILCVGAVLTYLKNSNAYPDYVGTQQNPGITATKK